MSNEQKLETDVVVIGGGGAGIPAAIEAGRAGARVIVLEQADTCGGTAAISGGGCCIVGTPLQKSHGIEDTPDPARTKHACEIYGETIGKIDHGSGAKGGEGGSLLDPRKIVSGAGIEFWLR